MAQISCHGVTTAASIMQMLAPCTAATCPLAQSQPTRHILHHSHALTPLSEPLAEEESPAVRDWFTWRDVFHLVDIICCCAILFPIVWSIKHLREASQTDGKAARCLEKLTLFRQFYVMVVVYIYFTRIVVYLLKSTMQYEYAWVSDAAEELATLAFYVWTGVKFRPQQNNPYLKLHQEEIEL
jgi:hypothetical protein